MHAEDTELVVWRGLLLATISDVSGMTRFRARHEGERKLKTQGKAQQSTRVNRKAKKVVLMKTYSVWSDVATVDLPTGQEDRTETTEMQDAVRR